MKKKKIGYGEEKIVNLGGKVTFSTFSLLVSTFAPLFPKKCNLRNVQRYLYISLISSRWVDTIMHCCLMPANYTLASTSHGNTLLKLPPCTFQTTERHTHASVRKKKSSFYEWRHRIFVGLPSHFKPKSHANPVRKCSRCPAQFPWSHHVIGNLWP